jgi:hypothetical protein
MLLFLLFVFLAQGELMPCIGKGASCPSTHYCATLYCAPNKCSIQADCEVDLAGFAYCDLTHGVCLPKVCLSQSYCPSNFACNTTVKFQCYAVL